MFRFRPPSLAAFLLPAWLDDNSLAFAINSISPSLFLSEEAHCYRLYFSLSLSLSLSLCPPVQRARCAHSKCPLCPEDCTHATKCLMNSPAVARFTGYFLKVEATRVECTLHEYEETSGQCLLTLSLSLPLAAFTERKWFSHNLYVSLLVTLMFTMHRTSSYEKHTLNASAWGASRALRLLLLLHLSVSLSPPSIDDSCHYSCKRRGRREQKEW